MARVLCSRISRGGQVGGRIGLEDRGIGNQGSRLRKLGVEIQIQTQTQTKHGTNATANAPPQTPRLNTQGYPLGLKLLDLLLARQPPGSAVSLRPTRILPLLQFIAQTLWRHLFGRPADTLERSENDAAQYMLYDNEPLVNTYISLPREMTQLNCAAYVAGIIEGVCDGAGFATMGVSAHSVGEDGAGEVKGGMWPGKTVFLIKFTEEVLEREEILGRGG